MCTPPSAINLPYSRSRSPPLNPCSRTGHVSKLRWWLIMGAEGKRDAGGWLYRTVHFLSALIRDYFRNENARRRQERREKKEGRIREEEKRVDERGMERVSRQGNASAVNEQTLIFSRTKTRHPLTTTYLPPTTSQPLCSGTCGRRGEKSEGREGDEKEGWGDTASAMHTTAIIIVRRRNNERDRGKGCLPKEGGRRDVYGTQCSFENGIRFQSRVGIH